VSQNPAITVITPLELLTNDVFRMLLIFFPKHCLVESWIELLANNFHPRNTLLLQHINKLFVEALITAMEGLGFFPFRVELLTGALEIVHHRKDFSER
jgi:hypothetical protein